jgi:predicted alpha/beta superfamily hydrolase
MFCAYTNHINLLVYFWSGKMVNDKTLIAVCSCSTYKINNAISGHFTPKIDQLINTIGIIASNALFLRPTTEHPLFISSRLWYFLCHCNIQLAHRKIYLFKHLTRIILIIAVLTTHFANASTIAASSDGLYSKILDEQRQIVIQLPQSYNNNQNLTYPVFYLLSGPGNLAHTAGTLDRLNRSGAAPEMIVVGIANTDRTRDFTPTVNTDPRGGAIGSGGGGDKFLDFIESELIPYIDKKYRTKSFKIFAGNSIGGLLVIHSLQSRPHLFQAHFAFSPAVWWSNRTTLTKTKAFFVDKHSKNAKLQNFLYMNIGSEGGEMRQIYDQLASSIKQNSPELFTFKSESFENVPHSITSVAGLFNAYRSLFGPLKMPASQAQQGLTAIKQYYQALSQRFGYEIQPPETIVNDVAYHYLHDKKQSKTAIQLFTFNVTLYPDSPNVYDGLADALAQNGQVDKALHQMTLALKHSDKNHDNYEYFKSHQQKLLALKQTTK